MSYLDNIVIPFRRRDKRDISLSRITTSPINLDSHYSLKAMLLNPGFKRKKRNKSQFAQNLLNEILPEILPKAKTILFIPVNPKKRTARRGASRNISLNAGNNNNSGLHLEEIAELNSNKKEIKKYEKNCNVKKHQSSNKLISNFLTPVNCFISSKFRLNMDDYTQLTAQIKKRVGLPPRMPMSQQMPLPYVKKSLQVIDTQV